MKKTVLKIPLPQKKVLQCLALLVQGNPKHTNTPSIQGQLYGQPAKQVRSAFVHVTLFPFQYSHPALYSINKYSIKLSFEVVCWLATIMLQIPGLRGSYRNPFPKYSVGKRIDALSPGVPPAPPFLHIL